MKKILIFEDRLGFVDGPQASTTKLEIKNPDGSILVPEEEIDINVDRESWNKIQEDREEIFNQIK